MFQYTKVTRNGNKVLKYIIAILKKKKNPTQTPLPKKKTNQQNVHGEQTERTHIVTIIHTLSVVGYHIRYISVSDKALYP